MATAPIAREMRRGIRAGRYSKNSMFGATQNATVWAYGPHKAGIVKAAVAKPPNVVGLQIGVPGWSSEGGFVSAALGGARIFERSQCACSRTGGPRSGKSAPHFSPPLSRLSAAH
jgi:hypothetical protein